MWRRRGTVTGEATTLLHKETMTGLAMKTMSDDGEGSGFPLPCGMVRESVVWDNCEEVVAWGPSMRRMDATQYDGLGRHRCRIATARSKSPPSMQYGEGVGGVGDDSNDKMMTDDGDEGGEAREKGRSISEISHSLFSLSLASSIRRPPIHQFAISPTSLSPPLAVVVTVPLNLVDFAGERDGGGNGDGDGDWGWGWGWGWSGCGDGHIAVVLGAVVAGGVVGFHRP
uniref:Uncharacterized protein n=1 Tax=Leersia perrieri TaxID=77586 RepID=A0A0D9WY89_9ORYZ